MEARVPVRPVVDKVPLGLGFLQVFRVCPVCITPPMLHTNLHLNITLINKTSGQILGVFYWHIQGRRGGWGGGLQPGIPPPQSEI